VRPITLRSVQRAVGSAITFGRTGEGIAAALTSVVLVILMAMYVVSFGSIICGGLSVLTPDIRGGDPSTARSS
jgi:hypothetical protein